MVPAERAVLVAVEEGVMVASAEAEASAAAATEEVTVVVQLEVG